MARCAIGGLPIIAGVFDILENTFILLSINRFLGLPIGIVENRNLDLFMPKRLGMIGGLLTFFKWTFLVALPTIVFLFELVLNPRADEELFYAELEEMDAAADANHKTTTTTTKKNKKL